MAPYSSSSNVPGTPQYDGSALPNSRTINENAGMAIELDSSSNGAAPWDSKAEPDYLQMILSSYVYDVAVETPLAHAVNLSSRMGNNVYLKREDLQPVFSFKIRGAHNKISHLSEEEKRRGIIACSAGNHAQGVAMSAKQLGIKATIVMPVLTPAIKWKNVERLGAKVVLHGSGFDEAKLECSRLEKLHGLTNIPPFDDPLVIAGQGTIGMEILRQKRPSDIDAIFVAIGGGGLIAGIGAYVKRVHPGIRVIGVETEDSCAMAQSLRARRRLALPEVGLFADGTAVCQVGKECFRVAQSVVDDVVLVTNDEVCAAIKDVFEDTRSVLEPSGALATAGLKRYVRTHGARNQTLVAVTSGANMNFDRLRFVTERTALGEQREVLMSVVIPERPGAFHRLHDVIFPRAITEFAYRYGSPESARIFVAFEVKDRARETAAVIEGLQALGMAATDLTDNELAKSHARHIIGGRSSVPNEYLIRFEFPERHGALKKFLAGLRFDWNISLFQYRNFGHDVAKVLVGVQDQEESRAPGEFPAALQRFLDELDYRYVNETNNPLYQQFMRY
ncbi:threonine deaminase [Coemansia javaensis]|uniref:Threonine dehydratase n=1 Tax=Coemansia javaensis TaxID=2761396 RepID=A0A9W8HAR5_9FUNG|nr:threonine deaminase [Coemansia javaensis]